MDYTGEGMVEVIREGEIVRVSEGQAIEEDLFILRKVIEPEKEPIYNPVSRPSYRREVSGIDVPSFSRLESWRAGKFNLKKNKVIEDLKDNFHWEIARRRRSKGVTRKDLAEAIGCSEEEVKTIELGELPRDDFVLINKIEDYLGVNLRREKKPAGPTLSQLQEMKEDKVKGEIEKIQKREMGEVTGDDIELIE